MRKPNRLYLAVRLRQFDNAYVHHLVCSTFVAPRPGDMGCAHLDGNRLNNKANNLLWKTQKDNEDDKRLHGTWFKRITNGKLTPDQVREIRAEPIVRGSAARLSERMNVSVATILNARKNKSWKHIP